MEQKRERDNLLVERMLIVESIVRLQKVGMARLMVVRRNSGIVK